jgi:hypothetical protein
MKHLRVQLRVIRLDDRIVPSPLTTAFKGRPRSDIL